MLAFWLSSEADLQVTLMTTQIHPNLQIEENKATTASAVPGDLGTLLHRAKYAGTTAQDMAKAIAVRDHIEKELVEAIRNKDAGREADCRQALAGDATVIESGAAHLSQLLRLWTAEVIKRGRAPLGTREHGMGCAGCPQALPPGGPALASALAEWRCYPRPDAGCQVCP
jgi:hypothetical protein